MTMHHFSSSFTKEKNYNSHYEDDNPLMKYKEKDKCLCIQIFFNSTFVK